MSWFKTFDSKQKNPAESTERQKTRFPEKIVENADLHKPVLNKILTNP